MALIGELKPWLNEMARNLRIIANNTCGAESNTVAVATAGGATDVPEGYKSVAIVATNITGGVVITFADGTTYTFSANGETFIQSAPNGASLPAYDISGSGTWKWQAIK